MRRSEAVLLFLFIATAVIFFTTRPTDGGATPIPGSASAAGSDQKPSSAVAAPLKASAKPLVAAVPTNVPAPTPTPVPPYFSSAWAQAHPATDLPPITAQGAIVLDRDTQQILYAKNMDARRTPASIMKLMTAMVTLDQAKPSQVITVTADAANMEPNKMGISRGEQLTVQELMYGMLLDSGNDAAEALADGTAGSRDAFVSKMNLKAASLGLHNTHFVDAAGLDDANYTSPYDMAVIGDAALSGYPTIRTIVQTKQIAIPSNATHKWFGPTNLNDLLWDYPGTYGMKVGFTDAAQYTIVLAGQKAGHNVMIVLMGSQHHFTEGHALFDWAYAHLSTPDSAPIRKFPIDVEKT